MRMDHLWNGTDQRNTEVLREVPVPLPLFVHHKLHTERLGI